ncbi:MAG TPA: DUF6002 family protein [Acidimicrobiales bacterium]|jgi:hypothetical protein
MSLLAAAGEATVVNVLDTYRAEVQQSLDDAARSRPAGGDFDPGWDLPEDGEALRRFWSVAEMAAVDLGTYLGRRLTLLDLMRNPGTRTTKTLASLVMVARAAAFVRRTGEPVMIVTPSSANKATALRDAVLRAVESGLVTPDELRIAIVVPAASTGKLWGSALCDDPELAARNPVFVHGGPERAGVKAVAREFVDRHAGEVLDRCGVHLWYTLDLANYMVADATRALFERDAMPAPPDGGRLHAHAVSSAFGLLGHHLGHTSFCAGRPDPRYFLVQHLDTPDMVLSLYTGSTSRQGIPAYDYDETSGLYRQDADPHFPALTFDPDETLETTFYTHQPPTSEEMNRLIRSRGGGGIVVSLAECLRRYGEVRRLLGLAGVAVPADPRRVREWSLVMAVTGVLNAIDRGLVPDGDDVLVHGSGCYADDQYEPIPAGCRTSVATAADLRDTVLAAAARREGGSP